MKYLLPAIALVYALSACGDRGPNMIPREAFTGQPAQPYCKPVLITDTFCENLFQQFYWEHAGDYCVERYKEQCEQFWNNTRYSRTKSKVGQ